MTSTKSADPAAIFAASFSLWQACLKYEENNKSINLSNAYNGMDNLMRVVVNIAMSFENWTCQHVNFDDIDVTWPYLLEEEFGKECLSILLPENLHDFDNHDCQRIASKFRLPRYKNR